MENSIKEPEIKYFKCEDIWINYNRMNWIACVIDAYGIRSIFIYNCEFSGKKRAYIIKEYIGGIIIGERYEYLYVNYKENLQYIKKIYYKATNGWYPVEKDDQTNNKSIFSEIKLDLKNQNQGKKLIEQISRIMIILKNQEMKQKNEQNNEPREEQKNKPSIIEAIKLHNINSGFIPGIIPIKNLDSISKKKGVLHSIAKKEGVSIKAKKEDVPNIKKVNFIEER